MLKDFAWLVAADPFRRARIIAALLVATIILMPTAIGAPADYSAAKRLAEETEAKLGGEARTRFLREQARLLASALSSCDLSGLDKVVIDIVLLLRADGSVAQSWRNNDLPATQCLQQQLQDGSFAGDWPSPFYTSFGLSFVEK